MLTEVRARPVIGPVVSSERTTSRKGLRNTLGSTSDRAEREGERERERERERFILREIKYYADLAVMDEHIYFLPGVTEYRHTQTHRHSSTSQLQS